ncbi:MAG: hypothetical protein ACRDJN_26245 [Chloroflexota bacterium]
MQLTLETEKRTWRAGESVVVRLIVYNEAYEPVEFDRRLLVGPNPVPATPSGIPMPISLEPSLPRQAQNQITLNPWCLYGRQRTLDNLPPGQVTVYGYLLCRQEGTPTPQGPQDSDAMLAAAEPLVLTIEQGA